LTEERHCPRRAVLKGALAVPFLGTAFLHPAAAADAPRVVTLEWLATEMCLSLGITPVGVGDLALYRDWVGYGSERLAGVETLGARAQPGLETIRRLAPDLILGSVLRNTGLRDQLVEIAPTVLLEDLTGGDQLLMVDRAWDDLCKALGCAAEEKAEAFSAFLGDEALRLTRDLPGGGSFVLAQLLPGTSHMRALTSDAAATKALIRTGLSCAFDDPSAKFGFVRMGPEGLARLDPRARLLLLDETIPADLAESRLWKALPVVREGRVRLIGAHWAFGGYETLSALVSAAIDQMVEV
jgi:ABC-type Fe3+-citrate transport system substrate-binding protein